MHFTTTAVDPHSEKVCSSERDQGSADVPKASVGKSQFSNYRITPIVVVGMETESGKEKSSGSGSGKSTTNIFLKPKVTNDSMFEKMSEKKSQVKMKLEPKVIRPAVNSLPLDRVVSGSNSLISDAISMGSSHNLTDEEYRKEVRKENQKSYSY